MDFFSGSHLSKVWRWIVFGVLPFCNFLFWARIGVSVEDIRSTSRCTGNLRSGGGRIGSVVIHRKEVDYTALEPELCSDDDAGHGQEQHRGPIDDGGHLILPGVNKKAMTASAKVLSKGCSGSVPTPKPRVLKVPTKEFDAYRVERMSSMQYATKETVVLLSSHPAGDIPTQGATYSTSAPRFKEGDSEAYKEIKQHCTSIDHQWVGTIQEQSCLAVVKVENLDKSPAVHRFDPTVADQNNREANYRYDPHHPQKVAFVGNEHNAGHERPVGYFRKIPKERGFQRVTDKLGPFVAHYNGKNGIAAHLDAKLKLHNIRKGDGVTVMVVNEGEIDLFMNFACSCRQHEIPLTNVVVFAASPEIVPLIESTGAVGMFHEGYASVSKSASHDYLDRVFVDMMWYKAFAVHLMTNRGINVLFQDVDLVWFRDPFPYFKMYRERAKLRSDMSGSYAEAFFSDDGQRSLRYSPFFANSGFYYMIGGPKSAYLAWSIMTAFDAVQVLGSHQNVFTYKMVEGLGLNHRHAVILSLEDFPNGIMYHHDKPYMKKLQAREVSPYGFHMCWTQGKPDKLKYLKIAKMWYLQEQCSALDDYIHDEKKRKTGEVYSKVRTYYSDPIVVSKNGDVLRKQKYLWDNLSSYCCQVAY